MQLTIEKRAFSSGVNLLIYDHTDYLSGSIVNELRSKNATIKSWHAFCRITAVSKILDWLVK